MSKRPFTYELDSPNIVIVPTVSFCKNERPAKKQKLEIDSQTVSENLSTTCEKEIHQTCDQSLEESVKSDTTKVSPGKIMTPKITEGNQTSPVDSNTSCASENNLNTTPNKPTHSWASNYLMSIGESYKKPLKLNISLPRTNENAHKIGEPVQNLTPLVDKTNISNPETSLYKVAQPEEINEKANDKLSNVHEPINKWISPTNTKNEESTTEEKPANDMEKNTTEYENERYKNMDVNNCMRECCRKSNILAPKSTKEMILNNKEASKIYNNFTHNPIKPVHNISTKIHSEDYDLYLKSTNHLNENESNKIIAMTNKYKTNEQTLTNPIYKSSYKLVNTTKDKNDYFDLNPNHKSRPNKNKNEFKGDTATSFKYNSNSERKRITPPKHASNSSSDFETNSIRYKSHSIYPKYVTKFNDSRNKYKSELTNGTYYSSKIVKYLSERPNTPGKKYRTATSDNSATSTEYSHGSNDKYKLYKNRQENIHQPKSSLRPILRNRRYSEDVPKSRIHKRIKSPDNKEVNFKSKETCKNDSEVKYYENDKKTYTKNIASVITSKTRDDKNKQQLQIDKSLMANKSKSKTKLKSPKYIEKLYHDVHQYKPSTSVKSIVQVKESFSSKSHSNVLKLSQNVDLRTKISGKRVSLNHYFSKLQNSTKKDLESFPMKRENLIITVENGSENEDMKSEEKSSDEIAMQIEKVPYKQIKLIINVIRENPISATNNNKDECRDTENENCALNNIDLSFLDDFNVDEIVESLNECETDSEIKEIADPFVSIETDSFGEKSLDSHISMKDSDKINNALDIHDEETMDLMESTENENIKESLAVDDQRSCFQEHFKKDYTENLAQKHTVSPDIEIIMKKSDEVLELASNIIVLEDSNDSDLVNLKGQYNVINNNEGNFNTFHSENNRDNENDKENSSLLDTIKIEPNIEENTLVKITVENTENNIPSDIKTRPNKEEHVLVVSTEHKQDNSTPSMDYIRLETNAEKKSVVRISVNEKENNTPSIDSIKTEPTEEKTKVEENTSVIYNIKIEPSIEGSGESGHINDLSSLKNTNMNIIKNEHVHTEEGTVIVALDKNIKSEPIQSHIEEAQIIKHEDIQPIDVSKQILNVKNKATCTDNESKDTNRQLNNTPKYTDTAINTPSSNRDQSDLAITAENTISGKAVKVINPNSTEKAEDMSIATSDYEVLSLDPIHGKPKVNNLELKKSPQIANLEGPDKFLVKHLEQRMFSYLREKYTVTSYIHKGKFSKIFQCKNSRGHEYAAKIVTTQNTRYHLGKLKEEMLMRLQTDIPKDKYNCVFFFNGFGLKNSWCFLAEYYPKNLAQALKNTKEPFHIDVVQELSRQLVSACTVLRNSNVVHSDIKPSHILLNSTNTRLKLCGFDEAYYVGSVQVLPNIGTVNYRAPEIILGYSADFSIDVWSTALVMFEMATNKKLFPGIYNNDILFKQICTLGNVPYEMIQRSSFKDAHFKGTDFMRKMGFKGQDIVLCKNFNRNSKLTTTIFSAYNIWNKNATLEEKKRDYKKLTMFRELLERMLVMHPNRRVSIEFVYSNPFLFESVHYGSII